jgi:hypothetical protein
MSPALDYRIRLPFTITFPNDSTAAKFPIKIPVSGNIFFD